MFTIDPVRRTIRLDAGRGAPKRVETRYLTTGIGLGTTLASHAVVSEILPGSSAEAAGLKPGDLVLEIGERRLAELEPYSRAWTTVSR